MYNVSKHIMKLAPLQPKIEKRRQLGLRDSLVLLPLAKLKQTRKSYIFNNTTNT